MRGWMAPTFSLVPFRDIVYDPTVRTPICFDPVASKTVLPYYELRTKLGMEGNSPDEIALGVAMAYALGELPQESGCCVRLHVVRASASRSGHWRVASPHDGLRAVLHKCDAW
jgi:hypothetical protein